MMFTFLIPSFLSFFLSLFLSFFLSCFHLLRNLCKHSFILNEYLANNPNLYLFSFSSLIKSNTNTYYCCCMAFASNGGRYARRWCKGVEEGKRRKIFNRGHNTFYNTRQRTCRYFIYNTSAGLPVSPQRLISWPVANLK